MPGKIHFGADEFDKERKPDYKHGDLACWILRPAFLERDGENIRGFDFYVKGTIRRPVGFERIEILSALDRVGRKRYRKVRTLILRGSNQGECTLFLNLFFIKCLVKRFGLTIENGGMQDVLAPQ